MEVDTVGVVWLIVSDVVLVFVAEVVVVCVEGVRSTFTRNGGSSGSQSNVCVVRSVEADAVLVTVTDTVGVKPFLLSVV